MDVLVLSGTIQSSFKICALTFGHYRKPLKLLRFRIYQSLLLCKVQHMFVLYHILHHRQIQHVGVRIISELVS
jgi:hypothetical protein